MFLNFFQSQNSAISIHWLLQARRKSWRLDPPERSQPPQPGLTLGKRSPNLLPSFQVTIDSLLISSLRALRFLKVSILNNGFRFSYLNQCVFMLCLNWEPVVHRQRVGLVFWYLSIHMLCVYVNLVLEWRLRFFIVVFSN